MTLSGERMACFFFFLLIAENHNAVREKMQAGNGGAPNSLRGRGSAVLRRRAICATINASHELLKGY